MNKYYFDWVPGGIAQESVLAEMAELYSEHYGVWGENGHQEKGTPIKLTAARIREYASHEDTKIAQAFYGYQMVGYAIVVQHKVPNRGIVSWVTQFVVHRDHRNQGVGKRLLFSTWNMSNHYAWGILTSNPYAIRALEAATRRRCQPKLIKDKFPAMLEAFDEFIPYIGPATELELTSKTAQANTDFAVSHEDLDHMLHTVTSDEKPWILGSLNPKWEWVAFTFRTQSQESLSAQDIERLLAASDQITQQAYARMQTTNQKWAQYTSYEVDFILNHLGLRPGNDLLDFGCGAGRHCLALKAREISVMGVDYNSSPKELNDFPFCQGDCRTVSLSRQYDAAICLYDVVGSYADNTSNYEILANLRRHLKTGALCLISVMSLEYTLSVAKLTGNFSDNPDVLLDLEASNIMETTGNVFNGDYFFLDTAKSIVYRKEQFQQGSQLPVELIVRDRRYDKAAIQNLCQYAGFEVLWVRQVRAGAWEVENPAAGKELLLLCRAEHEPQEASLFMPR